MEFEIQGFEGMKFLLKKEEPGWSLWRWVDSFEIPKGKYIGQMSKAKYKPMGLYPNTIEYALRLVVEYHLATINKRVDFRTGMKYVNEYTRSLQAKSVEIGTLAGLT